MHYLTIRRPNRKLSCHSEKLRRKGEPEKIKNKEDLMLFGRFPFHTNHNFSVEKRRWKEGRREGIQEGRKEGRKVFSLSSRDSWLQVQLDSKVQSYHWGKTDLFSFFNSTPSG